MTALPEPAVLAQAFAAIGFSWQEPEKRHARGVRRFWGRSGDDKLTCVLLEPRAIGERRLRGAKVQLEWRSGEPPPVAGSVAEWQGRRWPALFDEPRLYFESRAFLIVEGRVPEGGFAGSLARYERWAADTGLAAHREYEPDLNGVAGFADREFVVDVEDRSPVAMLTVRRRDENEVADDGA